MDDTAPNDRVPTICLGRNRNARYIQHSNRNSRDQIDNRPSAKREPREAYKGDAQLTEHQLHTFLPSGDSKRGKKQTRLSQSGKPTYHNFGLFPYQRNGSKMAAQKPMKIRDSLSQSQRTGRYIPSQAH